jgi:hypothetical protein
MNSRRISIVAVSALLLACACSTPAPEAADSGVVSNADASNAPDAEPGSPDASTANAFCYEEDGNHNADVSALVAAYGGENYKDDLIAIMAARHPATAYLLNEQRNDSYFAQFSDSGSWSGMVSWLDTLSHEETHLFNAVYAGAQGQAAAIDARPDLIFHLPADNNTFARSEIRDDIGADIQDGQYANTYLQGSSGSRGFNSILDELSCYINELAAVGAVGEYYNGGVSLRDGAVAFLHFMQVYLQVARTEHPATYAALQGTPVYREVVFQLWLRTHYFLAVADDYPNLGIDDHLYRAHLQASESLNEIEMFTGHKVGDSHCEE